MAAAGFVDACRTAGVLILTHRRLLVDQFQRDLRRAGLWPAPAGPRSTAAGASPSLPPVTVETYAWFIKHHQDLDPDAYAVVLCDEAHTALGERPGAIRRFSKPTYIGMTATDQLLQKHVSDVFPAEIADFPLADGRGARRGRAAPPRSSAPDRTAATVAIVGGDFDQGELAAALDLDPLNWPPPTTTRSASATAGIIHAPVSSTPSAWRGRRGRSGAGQCCSGRSTPARPRRDARGLRARRRPTCP